MISWLEFLLGEGVTITGPFDTYPKVVTMLGVLGEGVSEVVCDLTFPGARPVFLIEYAYGETWGNRKILLDVEARKYYMWWDLGCDGGLTVGDFEVISGVVKKFLGGLVGVG